MIKFSIAIPCYKNKFLAETIDSILIQTYTNFEIIIVNDASPYNIDTIISRYHDSRVKYFKNKKNCGAYNVVENWNICLRHAIGDYLIMMGDDDKLEPNCLDIYRKLVDRYPDLNVYHGRTKIINEKSQFIRLHEARPEWESMRSLIWHRIDGRQQYIGDFLYKTQWLKDNKGFVYFPLAWGTDDMTAFLAAKDKGIANTNIPVFCYRINSFSISMSSYTDIKLKCNKDYCNIIINLIDNNSTESNIESLYNIMIKENIQKKFQKKSIRLFTLDFLSIGYLKTLKKFIRNKKKYDLPWGIFVMSFIEYIKTKKWHK